MFVSVSLLPSNPVQGVAEKMASLNWVGPHYAFRTALILCGTDLNKETLIHIDMIASDICCKFVGCTSMM